MNNKLLPILNIFLNLYYIKKLVIIININNVPFCVLHLGNINVNRHYKVL